MKEKPRLQQVGGGFVFSYLKNKQNHKEYSHDD